MALLLTLGVFAGVWQLPVYAEDALSAARRLTAQSFAAITTADFELGLRVTADKLDIGIDWEALGLTDFTIDLSLAGGREALAVQATLPLQETAAAVIAYLGQYYDLGGWDGVLTAVAPVLVWLLLGDTVRFYVTRDSLSAVFPKRLTAVRLKEKYFKAFGLTGLFGLDKAWEQADYLFAQADAAALEEYTAQTVTAAEETEAGLVAHFPNPTSGDPLLTLTYQYEALSALSVQYPGIGYIQADVLYLGSPRFDLNNRWAIYNWLYEWLLDTYIK
jgi:hypothetical protein